MSVWQSSQDAEGFVWLTLDCPEASTNTLSRRVLEALECELDALIETPPRGLVIRSGKPNGFAVGADIKEFISLQTDHAVKNQVQLGHRVFAKLEGLPCPTVAWLHGFALGGGLELALACRYRVGLDDGKLVLGLPEVQLGIHPGFGGTVRAVRLLGAPLALDLMLTGRSVRAPNALAIGLVERLAPSRDALDEAARALLRGRTAARRAPWHLRALSLAPIRPWLRRKIEARVRKKVSPEHYPAPYALLDLWARHGAAGPAAYTAEVDSMVGLARSATTRNLVRLFLLQDALKSTASAARAPSRIHVIGAGVMGGDIAALCALRGLEVTLQDASAAAIEKALRRAETMFAKRGSRVATEARARLRADPSGTGATEADVVIEAIVEDLAVKVQLIGELEARIKDETILATNTSSIPLEALAASMRRPERLVGLHFFNPVAAMPLVEIVRADTSGETALSVASALARRLDKLPLPCRSAPGFLVNRVLVPYLQEAMYIAAAGVPLASIDRIAKDFGMPMGPVELSDMVGLDVCLQVGEIVGRALGRAGPDPAPLRELIAAGHLGRKSGRGFYVWRDGKLDRSRPPSAAPSAQASVDNTVPSASLNADVADRLILALVNEAVACLRGGIVTDVGTLDAGIVFGTGFAPFRGGPLAYAADRGIEQCVARLEELRVRYGERFRPDPGWQSLAAQLSVANATTTVR